MNEQRDVFGPRIGAALIDSVLLGVVFIVLAVLVGDSSSSDSSFSANLGTGGTLVWLVILLGYYTYFEGSTGQTLGKRVLKVRVVGQDGSSAPGFGPAFVRSLLRIVDGLPFLYLLGFIVTLATGQKRQRLGDLAAKTRVVAA